jgi:hypothetical protein
VTVDGDVPAEVLMQAVELALAEGRSIILKTHGLVVVPDLPALRAIPLGEELPDTQGLQMRSEPPRKW